MGGAQSNNTRRISIPNEDPSNVIKVSDSVVQRLKGRAEGREGQSEPPPVSQPQSHVEQVTSSFPNPFYGRNSAKTSLEIRQDKEAALRENDEYWARKVRTMEENHMLINQKIEEEYKQAMKEVEEMFRRMPPKGEPPCTSAGQCVTKCFKENPKQILHCAREVEAFAACVDMKRVNILDSRQ